MTTGGHPPPEIKRRSLVSTFSSPAYGQEVLMKITHNGKQYTVVTLASGYQWRLTEVGQPNNRITLNRKHMQLAGLLNQVEGKS
jgi:hypothetical protein